jgi:hypothetical protein
MLVQEYEGLYRVIMRTCGDSVVRTRWDSGAVSTPPGPPPPLLRSSSAAEMHSARKVPKYIKLSKTLGILCALIEYGTLQIGACTASVPIYQRSRFFSTYLCL